MNTRAPINIDHYAIRQQVSEKMTDSIECRALVNTIVDTVVDVGNLETHTDRRNFEYHRRTE